MTGSYQGEQPTYPPPVPVRVCPKCSAQEQTAGSFCPHCGAPYSKQAMQKRVKVITAASVVALLIVAGLVVGLLAKHSLDQHQAKVAAASRSASAAAVAAASRTAAAKASAAAAKASAAAAAAAKSIEQTAERTRRKAIVKSLQADVTKNARKDVADGVLDGPIKYTDCTPLGGGSSDILLDKTGEFSCVAVNKITGTTESGYQFSAVVNWSAGSYSWHLGS